MESNYKFMIYMGVHKWFLTEYAGFDTLFVNFFCDKHLVWDVFNWAFFSYLTTYVR